MFWRLAILTWKEAGTRMYLMHACGYDPCSGTCTAQIMDLLNKYPHVSKIWQFIASSHYFIGVGLEISKTPRKRSPQWLTCTLKSGSKAIDFFFCINAQRQEPHHMNLVFKWYPVYKKNSGSNQKIKRQGIVVYAIQPRKKLAISYYQLRVHRLQVSDTVSVQSTLQLQQYWWTLARVESLRITS